MKDNNHTQPGEFPELVRFKSSTAKICRNRHRGRFRHEVRYHASDGVLQRGTFDDCDGAKEHAETIVRQLAKGGLDMIALRGRERFVCETAMERPTPSESAWTGLRPITSRR
jgi:hypothetical protein